MTDEPDFIGVGSAPERRYDIGLCFGWRFGNYREFSGAPYVRPRYVKPVIDTAFFRNGGPAIATMDRYGMLTIAEGHTVDEAADCFVDNCTPYSMAVSPGMLLSILDLGPCGPLERAFWLRVGERLREQMRDGGD